MNCLHPHLIQTNIIKDSHYKEKKFMYVDCGKCVNCLKKKRNELTSRLVAEMTTCDLSIFTTLTYDDTCLSYNENKVASLDKRDIQLFLKKVRRQLDIYNVKLRYFCAGEYGGQLSRPHYHIIFYLYVTDFDEELHKYQVFKHYKSIENFQLKIEKIVAKSWLKSLIKPYTYRVNQVICHYCTKDILKHYGDSQAPIGANSTFMLMSRKPGLGYYYLKDNLRSLKRLYDNDSKNMNIISVNGNEYTLSRYMRTKFKQYYAIDFTINDYYKLMDVSCLENDKHYKLCRMNYFNKNPTASEEDFFKEYFKDISEDLSRLQKYKTKVSHDIKKK